MNETLATMSATAQLVYDWVAAQPVYNWISVHPIQSFVYMVNFIVIAIPGAVTVPILALMGLATGGPVSGSFAAGLMGYFGFVPAGGWYAVFQSAAMGGYGVPIVNGIAQAGALLSSGVAWALGRNATAT